MPGPYRGRVVAIESRRSILSGQYQAATIQEMMRRGMTELTGDRGLGRCLAQFLRTRRRRRYQG